jgi:hypothetical protein
MEEKVKEVVKSVTERVIKLLEKGWTKGAPARRINYLPCYPDNPEAVSWCLLGALDKTKRELNLSPTFTEFINDRLAVAAGQRPGFKEALAKKPYLRYGAVFNDLMAKDVSEVIALVREIQA